MKITFVGDIMIEPPVLKAARQADGSYNFDEVFAHSQSLFDEADILIGNLETPMAGEEAVYTDDFYVFNAPDTYADAVKKAGFDMVATSNNHTYDRGYEGLKRTIKVLDEKGVSGQFSFEERMACGFGVCMGCSCQTKYGNKRICKDGPVLVKEEIVW